MTWIKKHIATIIIILVLLAGLGLLLYPSISDYWNSMHQSRAIMSYSSDVAAMNAEEYDQIKASAYAYNRAIAANGINWMMSDEEKELYNTELNFAQNGIMGYIQIDKINITLPIYHGTSESILQTSIGHLEGTSLPLGSGSFDGKTGEVSDPEDGSHCVLSGHRGLPSAKLFSDLDKLVLGDTFYINVLDETLIYQVDQIRIVEPTDLSELQLEKGMDYCTLVTCTPYGINTHRLLVRGHRITTPHGSVKVVADAIQIDSVYIAPFVAAFIIALLIVMLISLTNRRKKHNKLAEKAVAEYGSK